VSTQRPVTLFVGMAVWCATMLSFAEGGPDESLKQNAQAQLARVKIAAYYELISDGASIGRSTAYMAGLLKACRTELVFRAFMQGPTVLESPDDLAPELVASLGGNRLSAAQVAARVRASGYCYRSFQEAVTTAKRELPRVIITGALAAQWLNATERHPASGQILKPEETWPMALDPQKWHLRQNGQPLTKAALQKRFGITHGWAKPDEDYDWRKVPAYYPDLTNPAFQALFLAWAKRQVECGADAIWVDLLFTQAMLLAQLGADPRHPAVKDSYDAACLLVDEIHRLGLAQGKYILAGTWAFPAVRFPFPMAHLDFVTMTPQREELARHQLDQTKWAQDLKRVRARCGQMPVFVFIDCAGDRGVMAEFSQVLSKEEQGAMIRQLDGFCQTNGLTFAYPVHGGGMGGSAKLRSFGQSDRYDSAAPEFATFDVIKALALAKAGASAH